jgi:hypothetical protein
VKAGSRAALALLIVSLFGVAGPTECEQIQAQTQPAEIATPPTPASLKLNFLRVLPSGSGYLAFLTVQATVGGPLQAFDVDVFFTPGIAGAASAFPHESFSDDAVLAMPGTANTATGVLATVVDLRHGISGSLYGSPTLFNLLVRVNSRVPLWVQAVGELSRREGKLFATTPSARIRVLPPPL